MYIDDFMSPTNVAARLADHATAVAASKARQELGLCISARFVKGADGRRTMSTEFYCNNQVTPAMVEAQDGCALCPTCIEAQEDEEGRCDGLAARREDHQRDE